MMEDEKSPGIVEMQKPSENWAGWIESVIVSISQTSIGQTFLRIVDRFLWVVEKSAQWSLPSQEIEPEENGKSFGKMELVRPLPWILFLPALVILRAIRAGLNVAAFILGYPQIQPSGMVKFVQKRRRRLRALNMRAIKNQRRKGHDTKDKRLSVIEAKTALIRSIKLTLSTLSCLDSSKSSPSPTSTKIYVTGFDLERTPAQDERSATESTGSPIHTDAKRKFSEISSEEESEDESESEPLVSKINRLALNNSTDDPDFDPTNCSTDSASGSSEDGENPIDVSLAELEDIKTSANTLLEKTETIPPESLETYRKQCSQEKECEKEVSDNQVATEGTGYYSPLNFSSDGEPAFYSPISSNSGSPERWVSQITEWSPEVRSSSSTSCDVENGEVAVDPKPSLPQITKQEASNRPVPKKSSSNTNKNHHHKGKRVTNYGNRRKK